MGGEANNLPCLLAARRDLFSEVSTEEPREDCSATSSSKELWGKRWEHRVYLKTSFIVLSFHIILFPLPSSSVLPFFLLSILLLPFPSLSLVFLFLSSPFPFPSHLLFLFPRSFHYSPFSLPLPLTGLLSPISSFAPVFPLMRRSTHFSASMALCSSDSLFSSRSEGILTTPLSNFFWSSIF